MLKGKDELRGIAEGYGALIEVKYSEGYRKIENI